MRSITSAFDIVGSREIFSYKPGISVYFASMASKKHAELKIGVAKSSAIQNISVTLTSVIIAFFVCNSLYFITIKIQQISLITKFSRIYNLSNRC